MEGGASPGGSILVLEDDPGIARLQCRHLERAGFSAEAVATAEEARARLEGDGIDLLVLDYQLEDEGESGLDFYRSIHAAGRDLPAILVTGFSDEARVAEALRAGVRDYILKTPNFIELVAPTVGRVLQQVRAERRLVEAEAASRAKDDFFATLSHELRTPLTPVLALACELRDDPRLPADARADLEIICRNVALEARLIDDMLDLTRIVRGKLELRLETADLRPIIDHALKTCCAHEAAEKDITCHEALAEGAHHAQVDPARLMQVLWNLLKNAVKFTPVGGQLWMRTRLEPPALVIEVSDSGMGIEPAALPRIFGAFEQGGRGITQQFGGIGLGLAISKAIVDLHGGTLTAASPGRGQGATFTIRLPLTEGPLPVPAATAAPRVNGESVAETGAHLLLVEDHADTAHVMARMLRRSGFQVTVAGSCAQATAAAEAAQRNFDDAGRASPIGLVISDLGLPDGSGHDLMRELRAKFRLRGIALSGYGMEDDVQRAQEAGFVKHLTKPVEMENLLGTIRELLA